MPTLALSRQAFPKSIMGAVFALVVLPLTVLAGPDGRRLTLGDNRAYQEPALNSGRPLGQLAASNNQGSPPAGLAVTPIQADTPPLRVVPANQQAATPDFKPEPKAAAARVERVRHTPERKAKVTVKATSEPRHVRVTAPSTKVAVRDHKVRIDAPYTRVAVDEGRVRVRAPFVDLDIRF
jgi:hypothetical protein